MVKLDDERVTDGDGLGCVQFVATLGMGGMSFFFDFFLHPTPAKEKFRSEG